MWPPKIEMTKILPENQKDIPTPTIKIYVVKLRLAAENLIPFFCVAYPIFYSFYQWLFR